MPKHGNISADSRNIQTVIQQDFQNWVSRERSEKSFK